MSAKDAILGREVFILKQEFLINQPGDVRQQPSPFVLWHEEHPFINSLTPLASILTTRGVQVGGATREPLAANC